jgi:hypothetical protein
VALVLPGVQLVVNGFNSNNRSVPAMKLALQASEIILCVAKHPEALQHLQNVINRHLFFEDFFFKLLFIFQLVNLVESVIMNMYVSVTSGNDLFLNCCTILWVLAHDQILKEVLNYFLTATKFL